MFGAYVTYRDEEKPIGIHGIAFYVDGNNVIYFDSFGAEHIPKEIKNSLETKMS